MNFCPNCGSQMPANTNFCPNCGANFSTGFQQGGILGNGANTARNLLGTLVTVSLVNGLTKKLYQRGNNYYYDQNCTRPFNSAMILGLAGKTPEETATLMGMSGQTLNTGTMLKNKMTMNMMNFNKGESDFDRAKRKADMRYEKMLDDTTDSCFCPNCGKKIDANSKFCKYCGKRV